MVVSSQYADKWSKLCAVNTEYCPPLLVTEPKISDMYLDNLTHCQTYFLRDPGWTGQVGRLLHLSQSGWVGHWNPSYCWMGTRWLHPGQGGEGEEVGGACCESLFLSEFCA